MGNMYGGAPPPKKKPDKPLPEWKKKLKPGQLAGARFALSNCTPNDTDRLARLVGAVRGTSF